MIDKKEDNNDPLKDLREFKETLYNQNGYHASVMTEQEARIVLRYKELLDQNLLNKELFDKQSE